MYEKKTQSVLLRKVLCNMLQKVLKNTYKKIRKERKAKQMVVSYNGITEKQKV